MLRWGRLANGEWGWRGEPWRPHVREGPDGLTYVLPVESGFASLSFELPITRADLHVLRTDRARYDALFAALHGPFQLARTRPGPDEVRAVVDAALHGPPPSGRTGA